MTSIQNEFIPHLYKIIQQEKCQGINDFFKVAFREGNELFYFERNIITFKISLKEKFLHFMDEIEKIEVEISIDQKGGLQDILKRYLAKRQRQSGQKSIEQILMESFKEGGVSQLLGKKYLVYDIETSLIGDRLEEVAYYLGYSLEEVDQEGGRKMDYTCIMKEDLPAFVEKMLNFDGYIVGFNQIWFDNPVCIYNVGGTSEEIKKLNEKSIDLYVFIQQMTGKRIGLNKISESLIGISKNLEGGGASVESLWKEWTSTHNDRLFKKLQEYCKNDVRMTALLFLYLLHFQKLYIDGKEYTYDIPTLLQYAQTLEKKSPSSTQHQSLLW
ncbi:MAG: ribonuclease H-like domain-containing protein [Candidatus Peribacteria bacterium]|nr:ribonuclease H-like domain-containing protein [Candidatus Peribacteria bacterium]